MSKYNPIECKRNGVIIQFQDINSCKVMKKYYSKILDAIRSQYEDLKILWFDVGTEIYDLHIEIIGENESEDFYFEVKEGKLVENCLKKGFLFNELNVLSSDEESELCKMLKPNL